MQENMSRLHQRGEKLRGMGEKTAEMEISAQDFASVARQLAEKEKRKKWWQV